MKKSVETPEHRLLAELLRELRTAAGLTQIELAERLQETQSYVSKFERGAQRLDLVELRAVCRALEVPLSELVSQFEARVRAALKKRG